MSDKREEKTEENTEEGRLEDLPLEPMPEEEQSKVKGGSLHLGDIVGTNEKATLPVRN